MEQFEVGHKIYKIDDKRRILLPKNIFEEISLEGIVQLLLKPNKTEFGFRCLNGLPLDLYLKENDFNSNNFSQSEIDKVLKLAYNGYRTLSMKPYKKDKNSTLLLRIALPTDYLDYLGVNSKDKVALAYSGPYFSILSEQDWNSQLKKLGVSPKVNK